MSCKIPGLRYIVLVTSALCLTSLLSNMTTYNFTKICMTPQNRLNGSTNDVTKNYDKTQQSWLQACVAIGALAASLPYTYLFQHCTKKWVFSIGWDHISRLHYIGQTMHTFTFSCEVE
ncbi:hypothetical protein KIN20_013532 [Parelaphostrongylus tenuis]|uniref:Uncharacterized protein n=1 Tax=Parelaphostrongylus tenuis TaxID=148309 RepID=A0AAD5MXQ1_PARTN|nr:hypothetical protein KIN20_013532 [Parelaphostrongylus tenuis]